MRVLMIADQGVVATSKLKSYGLHCIADCSAPITLRTYATILVVALVVAAAWVVLRRLARRRKLARFGDS